MLLIRTFRLAKFPIYPFPIRNFINLINNKMESKVPIATKIALSEYEQKLFSDLVNIVSTKKLGTTLRVAGGWVRDKVIFKKII